MRTIGTVARGVRAPIIREGDNIAEVAAASVMEAWKEAGIEPHDRDVVAITESVVARAQGNYATLDQIAKDVREKTGGGTVGVAFPIMSRNRFSLLLRGMAMGCKKIVLLLSYPSDEVGNGLVDWDKLDEAGVDPYSDVLTLEQFREKFGAAVHPFTGVDYIDFYSGIITDAGAEVEVLFGNRVQTLCGCTDAVITCDIHTRARSKRLLKAGGAKIVLGLVIPITVALMLNELQLTKVKRSIQTIIYFPHFLSWIIFGSIIMDLLSPQNGIINKLLNLLGHESIYFLGDNKYFQQTIIWTDVWKNFGYGTVVYMASITSIDPSLYEAAAIDGANRWKQTWHITLPGMRMIIVLMMVLSLGNVLNAGFDQVYNMYSPIVYETGDIIDTMVYRLGLENAKYGPAAAVSIFKSVVSMLFISVSYYVADRFFDYRLF